jgi:hypothetical protein
MIDCPIDRSIDWLGGTVSYVDGVVVVVLRDVLRLCSKEELVSLACESVSYELESSTSTSILSVKEELVCVERVPLVD